MSNVVAVQQSRRAREYETIYIINPDLSAEQAEKVAVRVNDVVTQRQGTLLRVDNWGRRRLAYPIARHKRGMFVYLRYLGYADLVAELERNLRMLDEVMRYQTVKLRDEVDPATVEVDAEQLKFVHVAPADEEQELNIEEQLGMVPGARRPRSDDAYGAADAEQAEDRGEQGEEASDETSGNDAAET